MVCSSRPVKTGRPFRRSAGEGPVLKMARPEHHDGAITVVDARGHRCPTPTLRLRRALEAAPPGGLVRLLADDPLARIDVPHFLAATSHVLLSLNVREGVLEALVRRASEEPGA